MKTSKIRNRTIVFSTLLILVFTTFIIYAQTITIQVSPHILNLQSNGVVVTIHTDIAYSSVDGQTVTLNGVVIQSWKSDDRGNFVAKFNMDDIKGLPGLIIGGYNTLTLEGEQFNGDTFTGSEDVKVINKVPKGK